MKTLILALLLGAVAAAPLAAQNRAISTVGQRQEAIRKLNELLNAPRTDLEGRLRALGQAEWNPFVQFVPKAEVPVETPTSTTVVEAPRPVRLTDFQAVRRAAEWFDQQQRPSRFIQGERAVMTLRMEPTRFRRVGDEIPLALSDQTYTVVIEAIGPQTYTLRVGTESLEVPWPGGLRPSGQIQQGAEPTP